ncbi:cytochrome [Mycobacterium sp. 1554424.7]|nr:cytochrome [Mycobacterium sp. 1554424.7]
MSEFDSNAFFTNEALIDHPYGYYAEQRSLCPVRIDPNNGIVAVTGYEAAMSVYRDLEGFSACNAVLGPFAQLPFEPSGDDITDQIAQHRDEMPFSGYMATLDRPRHTEVRGLLSRLMTPRRLKENEEFMWSLADHQLDNLIPLGKGDFVEQFARPFAMLVIADLLGVPAEDHDTFREELAAARSASGEAQEVAHNPLEFLEERFTEYVEDRRRTPRNDVMTVLAQAKYPDESTPDVVDVVHLATFLFAAGQETTTQMLSFAMRELAEHPELQQRLREDTSLVPNFLEETLRMESPIKSHFRLTSKTTTIAGVPVPAGRTIMLLLGAFNRDPARFEDPDEFHLDRPNVREHVAFGRGAHTCPGASLARVEGRVTFERILARMTDMKISEPHHGPAGERRYSYDPTFFARGLKELHIEFSPVA